MKLATATLLAALCAVPARGAPGERHSSSREEFDARYAVGRAYTRLLFRGQLDVLWRNFTPDLQRRFGSRDALGAFARKLQGDFGDERRVIFEEQVNSGRQQIYTRLSSFSRYARGVELRWAFEGDAVVADLRVGPAQREAPTEYLNRQTRTPLTLPFTGTWTVLWGGATVAENRHASVADQRFAYDLFIMKGGKTYAGEGKKNEQYFCYGQPLVAPADGLVVRITDGVPDNLPGYVNPVDLFGNNIIIRHDDDEYSMLAHLENGSIVVRPGDWIRRGHPIARTGNSGTSTEPHLHYQLMDNANFLTAHGMPAQFESYLADGKRIERGEPRKGQLVAPADPPVFQPSPSP